MPHLSCTQCQQTLRVADNILGRKIKCPKCGAIFTAAAPVPSAAVHPSAPAKKTSAPPPKPEQIAARPSKAAPRPLPSPATTLEEPEPLETIEAPKRSGKGKLAFKIVVKRDPDKLLKGIYQGTLTSAGLQMKQGSKPEVVIPRGTAAEYQGRNRLTVELEGRTVQLQIVKLTGYQNRLTSDVADYLNGQKPLLPVSNYSLPWYYVVLVLLPLGIPILSLGGALPFLLGGGLCAANAAIVQRENWSGLLRGILSAVLAFMGYLGLGVLVLVTGVLPWLRGISDSEWRSFTPPDGNCIVLMPGEPKGTHEPVPGNPGTMLHKYLLELSKYNAGFVVSWVDLPNAALQRQSLSVLANLERDGLVQRMNGKLIGEKDLTIEGKPAREFQVEVTGARAIERVFLIPRTAGQSRLYILMAVGTRYTPDSGDAKKFFDSFQLLAPAAPPNQPPAPAGNPQKPPQPPQPANNPQKPPQPQPPQPSLDDLKPGPNIPRFSTAVVDPDNHLALFVDGQHLISCAYPSFQKKDSYLLGEPVGFASALDCGRGLLYLAVCKPQKLQGSHPNQQLLGTGDIQVHDIQALREGKIKSGAVVRPKATIPLGKKIARILLSPDGESLYYLDVTDTKNPKIGRIDTMAQKTAAETTVLEKTEDISLTPDGKTLYAGGMTAPGKGAIQAFDPVELKRSKEIPLPGVPFGIAAADNDIVYAALIGQWTDAITFDVRQSIVTARWSGLYGRCLIQLAPNRKRLYVAVTDLSPTTLSAWKLPEKAGDKPLKVGEQRGGATPQFVITPDGRFLLNRAGQSFQLTGGAGS